MNIEYTNQHTSFGTLLPTKPLIKSALGNQNFQEAKELNLSLGIKYSGHIGFHKRAVNIANKVCAKNEKFNEIIQTLKNLPSEKQEQKIEQLISTLGDKLDVST